jgi:hypothetical protein
MAEDFGLLPWQFAPQGYGILPMKDRFAPYREGEDRKHYRFFTTYDDDGKPLPEPLTCATPLEAANYCREDKAKRDSEVE